MRTRLRHWAILPLRGRHALSFSKSLPTGEGTAFFHLYDPPIISILTKSFIDEALQT